MRVFLRHCAESSLLSEAAQCSPFLLLALVAQPAAMEPLPNLQAPAQPNSMMSQSKHQGRHSPHSPSPATVSRTGDMVAS